jgi:CDP-paratose 2-epimerase
MIRDKVTLVTGAAGFVGTNLAHRLLEQGERVRVLDDLSRPGVERNLEWLEREHGAQLQVETGDVCDSEVVARAMSGASSVFHFAAQVAVTTSLDDPAHDASVNLLGTLNLLEAARAARTPLPVVFTSTNKVYGALDDIALRETGDRHEPVDRELCRRGVSEARHLEFCTPYGCSKGAADQYVLDWQKSFGVPTAVFRMSCIYGPHQFGNEDQGWVAHFLISALAGEPITIYGDGKQVRDILFVEDLVDALVAARAHLPAIAGRAFNIGGGPANAVSLREVTALIEELTGSEPELAFGPWRKGDQRWYVSDPRAFGQATGWRPTVTPRDGLARLHEWLVDEHAQAVAEAA